MLTGSMHYLVNYNISSMLRRTGLAITFSIFAIIVLVLAIQLKDPDSTLMRLLSLRTPLLHLQRQPQARRAFTPSTSQASSYSTTSSKMASNSNAADTPRAESQEGTPLGLPAPPTAEEAEAIKLDMSSGGDTVRLDSLGPMVVNKDGSISRIGNWEQMTEMEQKNTMRIVGKRNKQRLEALNAAGGTEDNK